MAATLKLHGLMSTIQDEQKKVDMRKDIIAKLRKEVGKTTLETNQAVENLKAEKARKKAEKALKAK